MPKTQRPKLRLHRETVRSLTEQAPAAYPYTAMSRCPECGGSELSSCRQPDRLGPA
ncbi:MAG TPA: hypothetical protein VF615_10380 [Longimicrobiaceae bacterium]|jgi:hypothetical protein